MADCVYKYDAKQLGAGEDKQQDAQPLLEERTLGSDGQAELVDENDLLQLKYEELKASYQQLQAELDDEKEVQAMLIQAMQSLRPKKWVIAELEDKLLVQQATGTALLNDSHQRRSDVIKAIKFWSSSTVDTAIQVNSKGDGMSTGATGVTSSPHHQSSTVTAPVSTQQQLPAAGRDNALILTKPSTSSTYPSSPSSSSSSSSTPSSSTSFSSSSFSSSSSSTNQVIPSVEKLLLALPTITDPVGFGLRLGLRHNHCEQIIIRNHGHDINAQVREIAAEWYNLTPCPTWNKVVEALYKHGLVRDAVHLASKVGVKSPLPQEDDGDNDYH